MSTTKTPTASRTIDVNYLARVEGEGGLHVTIRRGKVENVALRIFEPPRFFEAFLQGRHFTEVPDIVARICGICPVAHQMSAVHAIEDAFNITVDEQTHALRRLLYLGEWIESHGLHVYMLHAPDFLGYEDAIRLAKDYPEIVERGLQLKKLGNDLMIHVGGREIHPINVRVGGFYRLPAKRELAPLAERLKWARDAARETVEWTSTLDFPELERDYEFVALRPCREYPVNEGRVVSNKGLSISPCDYEKHFEEEHVAHSNALQSHIIERGSYLVGPMARYNLNFDKLPPSVQEAALRAGLGKECRNPFKSIVIRSVEMLYACEEALRIIEQYEAPAPPEAVVPRAGIGHGCTEAPRGLLYHRYKVDERGTILNAKIVPPTSQNQKTIEEDLRDVVSAYGDMEQDELKWRCEQTVRNYDPCISCATHFLRLEVDRD